MRPVTDVHERFWSKVKIGNEDDCWEWQNYKKETDSYGRFMYKGTPRPAHQVAYELVFGNYKEDVGTYHNICVLHKCDNKKCVNPSHLFLGSQDDNNKDKQKKGRASFKLTEEDYSDILFFRSYGFSQKVIGSFYNVCQQRIWRILNERTKY